MTDVKNVLDLNDWPLGLFTDRLIADNSGYSAAVVGKYRRRKGIPAWKQKGATEWKSKLKKKRDPKAPLKRAIARVASREIIDGRRRFKKPIRKAQARTRVLEEWPLGLFPDAVIAVNSGFTRQRVHQVRKCNGIPPFNPSPGRRRQ